MRLDKNLLTNTIVIDVDYKGKIKLGYGPRLWIKNGLKAIKKELLVQGSELTISIQFKIK